jgi:predicted outer membrane protein
LSHAAPAAAPAGAAWDKRYIDLAVTHHTAVLVTAQSAMASAHHPEIKAMIEKAAPIVQQHLDHARSIQSKLP